MRQRIGLFFLVFFLIGFISCGGKKTSADGNADPQNKDTNAVKQTSTNTFAQDTMLSSLKPLLEKGLDKWIQSFPNFHIDSFRQSDIREFQVNDFMHSIYHHLVILPIAASSLTCTAAGFHWRKKEKRSLPSAMLTRLLRCVTSKQKAGRVSYLLVHRPVWKR